MNLRWTLLLTVFRFAGSATFADDNDRLRQQRQKFDEFLKTLDDAIEKQRLSREADYLAQLVAHTSSP